MFFIKKIWNSIKQAMVLAGRARVYSFLIRQDQEWLEKFGYSVKALKQGVSAWPWRKFSEDFAKERIIRQSVKELRAYSDRDLQDIGMSRSDIEQAVRSGRSEQAANNAYKGVA